MAGVGCNVMLGMMRINVPWYDPEHGEVPRHLIELGKGRILVNGHMWSRARCALQVGLEDGRTPLCRNFLKVNVLVTTVT